MLRDVIPPAIAWFIVLSRLKLLVANPKDAVVRSFMLAFSSYAMAASLNFSPLADRVDALLGDNAAWLLLDILFLIGGYFSLVWFSLMTTPEEIGALDPRVWHKGALVHLVLTVLVIVVLTVWAGDDFRDLEKHTLDVRASSLLLLCRLVFLAYVFFFTWSFSQMLSRYISLTDSFHFRVRARISLWGVRAAMLYPLVQTTGFLAYFWSPSPQLVLWWDTSDTLIKIISVPLIGAACLPGGAADSIVKIVSLVQKQIVYRKLIWLRRLILQYCPSVILDRPRHPLTDCLDPRDIDYRLSRALIEISDGRKQLALYADGSLIEALSVEVGGQPDVGAMLEATFLASVIARKGCGMLPLGEPVPIFYSAVTPLETAAFYARVAGYLRRGTYLDVERSDPSQVWHDRRRGRACRLQGSVWPLG